MPKLNPFTKRKLMTILYGGAALAFSSNPVQHFRTIRRISGELKKINEAEVKEEVRRLYRSKLVNLIENDDETTSVILNHKGREKVLRYKIDDMKINKHHWDKKWRLVLFDVPETKRKGRDALRDRLEKLGFFEYQKSAFVYPFECRDEIEFLIEYFGIKPYVRYAEVVSFDNDLHLKKFFKI